MSRPVDPRLLRAVPRVRLLIGAYAGLQVASAAFTVGFAAALANVLVAVVRAQSAGAVRDPLVALALIGSGRAAVAALQEWLASRTSLRIQADLRSAVLAAIRRLGPGWAQQQPGGRLISAAGPGLDALDGYLTRALPAVVSAAIVPPVVLGWIVVVDWRSGVILVVVLPLVPLFMALVGVRTGRYMQRQYEVLARLSGHFLDVVSGLTSLRIYGRAERQAEVVRRASESYRRHTMATLRTAFLSGLVLDLVATLSVAVVAVDVGLRLDHGHLGLTAALVVLLLAPELFAPLRAMGAQHHASEEGRAVAGAALDVLDAAARLDDARGASEPAATGSIYLRNLEVTHPGRAEPALHGLSLDIGPGEIVGLRGRSGAGKSTVLSCLLGFTVPSAGTVALGTLEGVAELAGCDPDAWRAQLAWTPQRPRPTQATVAAEVLLGDPAARPEQVSNAIAACHAPHPDTELGEDGHAVSAGQRRRVALARALLRARSLISAGQVPVVLLDEPSEDLDELTEAVVISVLDELAGRATVLLVTHSEAMLAAADRVVELAAGQLVSDTRGLAQRAMVAPALAAERRCDEPVTAQGEAPEQKSARRVLPPMRTVRVLAAAGGVSGLAGLAGLALTASSIWLIARASEHPNVQALAVAVVGVRTFALGRALLRYLERLVAHDGALRLLADVRARVFAALVPLVPAAVNLRRGDLLRRFVTDVDGVQEGLVRAVVPTLGATVTCAGAVVIATALVPSAGAALAAGLVVGMVIAPLLARAVAGRGDDAACAAAARDSAVAGLLDGLAELTAYGADSSAIADVRRRDAAVCRASSRRGTGAATGVLLAGAATAATLPLVLALGADASSRQNVSGVAATVLAACVLAAFDALAGVPAAFAAWSRFRSGLRRVGQLLNAPVPFPDPVAAVPIARSPISVQLAAADISPAIGAPVAIYGIDIEVTPRSRVAVIGPSGCGKSTVLAAAMRLLPLATGTAYVHAGAARVDMRQLGPHDMPPLVAGSLQGDHVFDTSLRDNLRFVRPAASDADLEQVAARAGLLSFIGTLPKGWSTIAGPDGANLSGGQRQRLLLARALLAAPAVLVLDEPTAHLDADTEREVIAELLAETYGRTVLLSTHRRLPPGSVDQVVDLRQDQRPGPGGPSHPDVRSSGPPRLEREELLRVVAS